MNIETKVGCFVLFSISVFLYLSLNIKAFRFDRNQYAEYKTYFDDTGGLTAKSPVRIAGVEVGWVETIKLLPDGKAELFFRVEQRHRLAKNAYAMIHQDGLIGTKSIEIDPGDPSTGILLSGGTLAMPGKTPTSVGELLEQFRGIAMGIQDITSSLKSTIASRQGEKNINEALAAIALASNRMADATRVVHETLANNEKNINAILTDITKTASEIKEATPKVATTITDTGSKISEAADQATGVFEKVNAGRGTVGKLINEDDAYYDLKHSLRGIKNYLQKTQSLIVNVDMHSEMLVRTANNKGYAELRLRPHSDYFYLIQLVADEFGSITREVTDIVRRDDQGSILRARDLQLQPEDKIRNSDQIETTTRRKNSVLFSLQFGKRFNRVTVRLGLFENTFGAAVDYYVPLKTNFVHWITTLEAFDFSGVNRLNDGRPHIKWINKVFFARNFYTTFGLDDICSKHNANPFLGGGFRFGDDDLKYYLSSLPLAAMMGSSSAPSTSYSIS